MYQARDHSFIICAYKESPYLEECIVSLINQKVRSEIAIATSTPNATILSLAQKYGLKLYENHGQSGIAGDWNFALSCVKTALVTIAHQDDIYLPCYTDTMLKSMNRAYKPIMFCSNYCELREGKTVFFSSLIGVKKIMSLPMKILPKSVSARRFAISFGNGICCPTVTYVTDIIKQYPFEYGMKSNLDWSRWDELSKLDGSFVYSSRATMLHRIHADAETSLLIGQNSRINEDYEMFLRFHGKKVAGVIVKIYALGEKSYR